MATKTNALGVTLAKALGLDPDRITKLTLTCEVGAVDVAEVTYNVVDAEAGEVTTELRNYVLTDVT